MIYDFMDRAYEVFTKGKKRNCPKTLKDRVIRFLTEGLGRVEVESKNRYRRFVKDQYTPYWVGKNGAVRAGKNPSNSISLTSKIHVNMRLWEKKENMPA